MYAQNATWDRMYTLEACLNDTYWRKYGLKTKLQKNVRCSDDRNDKNFEAADIIFLVILAVILLLNIVASYYEVWLQTRKGLGMLSFHKIFEDKCLHDFCSGSRF